MNGITILTGDARLLAGDLADESVDLILTDPVYDRIEDYRWLAETAARVLKSNSACLVYCGIDRIPEIHDAMRAGGLSYRWRLVIRMINSKVFGGKLLITSQEVLWYERGHSSPLKHIFDVQMSGQKGDYNVNGANWGKPLAVMTRFVETFSSVGGTVLDPFCGSGTVPVACLHTGRRCIAYEVKPDVAEAARHRVERERLFAPSYDPIQLDFETAGLARCERCGTPLPSNDHSGRKRRFCSNRCRQLAYRNRHGAALQIVIPG